MSKRARALAALGVAACVACCATPIVGALGSVAALGLVGTLFIGIGGLAVTIAAMAAFIVVRRRRAQAALDSCPEVPQPQRIDARGS